jgi:hypothetical protein
VPKETPKIQITIDDAPGAANGAMRALLAEFKIKTMFFVEGEFVAKRRAEDSLATSQGQRVPACGFPVAPGSWLC